MLTSIEHSIEITLLFLQGNPIFIIHTNRRRNWDSDLMLWTTKLSWPAGWFFQCYLITTWSGLEIEPSESHFWSLWHSSLSLSYYPGKLCKTTKKKKIIISNHEVIFLIKKDFIKHGDHNQPNILSQGAYYLLGHVRDAKA